MEQIKHDHRFIQFLEEFNITRDYYHCHDLLEELWMTDREHLGSIKYLLQVAVMQYKKVTGGETGFQTFLKRNLERYELYKNDIIALGIDAEQLRKDLLSVQSHKELYEFKLKGHSN